MFDKKAQAEAKILDFAGFGSVESTDLHGVRWDHRKYILEVRPEGEAPFRVETKAKVPIRSAPETGDLVRVTYELKSRKTEIVIEGDPRYDPKLVQQRKKQERAAREQALLSGTPVPGAGEAGGPAEDEPRWRVPAVCPECGARVDQSRASAAEHPQCGYCAKPLPCEPLPREEDY